MAIRTWVGGGSNNANDPTQWSPNGVPQPGDTLNMSGGTINITDDGLAGNTLNVASDGSAILSLKGITATAYAYDDNTVTLLNADQIADVIHVNTTAPLEVDQVGGDVDLFFNTQGTGIKLPGFLNPPFPAPYTPPRFDIVDVSTDQGFLSAGQDYSGPVPGIEFQLIEVTTDKLNITTVVPNVFIHGGSNDDAIDVSLTPGNNIIDGSTGSNFLVGATTGHDEFYVDDRSPEQDIWTTIQNLHAGDDATIWGLTPSDFVKTSDNVLATSPGLTFSVAGTPNVNLTIEGYTTADLSNGRLSVVFGRTPDMEGLPGSDFMQIHANS